MNAILIGNGSLLIQCAEIWLGRGQTIAGIVSEAKDIGLWAQSHDIAVYDLTADLPDARVDWLFSIANLRMIPSQVLTLARHGAINFHDGPLPRYAGLNAPVWALIAGEKRHGITWHLMGEKADTGDILIQREFDIDAEETALSMNTKSYAAGIEGFRALMDQVLAKALKPNPQNLSDRSYFSRNARPQNGAVLDFAKPAAEVARFVAALDHGNYANPLAMPKLVKGDQAYTVGSARLQPGFSDQSGKVVALDSETLTIACNHGAVCLGDLKLPDGTPISAASAFALGDDLNWQVPKPLAAKLASMARLEPENLSVLQRIQNAEVDLIKKSSAEPDWQKMTVDLGGSAPFRAALVAAFAARHGQSHIAMALDDHAHPLVNPWRVLPTPDMSLTIAKAEEATTAVVDEAAESGTFACDLIARMPDLKGLDTPVFALGKSPLKGSALSFAITPKKTTLTYDANRISAKGVDVLLRRLKDLAAADPETALANLPAMGPAESDLVLTEWNATDKPYDSTPIHHQFEAFAAGNPTKTAMVFQDRTLSFKALNTRANQMADVLISMGIRRGDRVGLYLNRGLDLMVALLAILKSGAAYVPLDPGFPADRIAHYVSDSGAAAIISDNSLAHDLPKNNAQLLLTTDARLQMAATSNPKVGAITSDLAYLIYTSGSTGTPKGVMVEHGNIANFMAAMDDRVPFRANDVWLAVTSLSFDISVLELLFTLTRGIKLVMSGDDKHLISADTTAKANSAMDFSIYYWGNDDATSANKYDLLLEGAKFADDHGFVAVWTPERHFHAFGGPYPNPAVTGAAVAAVTKNLAIRAGSIVAPLHHPARIAEEWAVIDNLTGGRVGLAMASGWQPDDFVLRPENTPPNNKPALFETIKTVRRLWAGEAVEFPTAKGTPHAVVTQPRPLSKSLPIWVTSAGNPDTWIEAANLGANVLTHLLGQTVAEVGEKIKIYHAALRKAGHDPKDFKVTVMLHTLIGEDREKVREIAREPMKDYLRSAAGLIKQYAYAFPAFKKPKGANTSFDLGSLEPDELEAILDFAFTRYFEDSGFFGTTEDAAKRVAELQAIGVGEVACLIDYGIDAANVMQGLRPLAAVVAETNKTSELAADDFSVAAQIRRHSVTHLQCTPSMARMMLADTAARGSLGQLREFMLGGEALGRDLLQDIASATSARVQNMYGPTETTIWSTTEVPDKDDAAATINIGTPIANTQVYVLNDSQEPVPVGSEGELCIAGDGVTRGYWQHDDLTNDRFLPNPFAKGRMYRTGDLVRWRADGKIDYLGRIDQQVKLRGYRIELGEIETALAAIDGIEQAVVTAREDRPGDVRLVAYLMGTGFDGADLRKKLSRQLPSYMVPSHFVAVDSFPLTPNKKVDRKALPAPIETKPALVVVPNAAPEPKAATTRTADELAREIASIWSEILGVEPINMHDNFFDLGGHSLLAVQAFRTMQDRLNLTNLGITDIFRLPKLSALAAYLAPTNTVQETPVLALPNNRVDLMAERRRMRVARLQKLQNR